MKFEVGDKVRLLGTKDGCYNGDDWDKYFYNIGRKPDDIETITSIKSYNEHYFTDNKSGFFVADDLELVEKKNKGKFNVGDKVKVIDEGYGCGGDDIGKIVTITEVGQYDKNRIGYKVEPKIGNSKDGQYGGFISEKSFKLYHRQDDLSEETNFKVGDRVRRIKDSYSGMYTGDTATIKKVFSTSLEFNEYDGTHSLGSFILVKEHKTEVDKKMKKFKVGDRVKVLNMPSDTVGTFPSEMVGEIVIISYVRHDYCVNDNKWGCNFCEGDLELVESKNKEKFKVGDKVEAIEICGTYHIKIPIGTKGVIYNIDSDNTIYAVFDGYEGNKHYGTVTAPKIKKIDDYKQTNKTEVDKKMEMEIKNIKKENLKEAKKQFEKEKNNSEVEVSKQTLRDATDNINRIDREIKKLEEEKKPYNDVISCFKKGE